MSTYIRSNNMRPSRVRNMVLEQLCMLPQPFTADQLVEACKAERISVGTVYNSLNLFILARILHAKERQRGRTVTEYELLPGNTMRMQIICENCSRVTEFHDKAIERLVRERKYSNFNIAHFTLYVYGECKLCRRKIKEDKGKKG